MDQEKTRAGKMPPAEAFELESMIDYSPSSVVSRALSQNKAGSVTMFSFDAGQGLSEHAAPYDAFVQVLDGVGTLTIGGKQVEAKRGDIVLMPANIPHAVDAYERFKMLLIMIRG